MATYKVIQDVEAEDKILGPLTLKQFVFGCVALGIGFVAFMVAKATTPYVIIIFVPLIIPPLVLALPLGRDQPTDVWLAAQIRFLLKPRKRIWDQSGIKELVTITAPKHIERIYTNGLDQNEVRSRLKALADTIDSRGWAVKNVNVNLYSSPAYAQVSDRLVSPSSLPQSVLATDVRADDDMLDPVSNPTAQHFDQLVQQAAADRKAGAIASMQAARSNPQNHPSSQPDDFYFLHQPSTNDQKSDGAMFTPVVVAPHASPTADDTFLDDTKPASPDEQEALQEIKSHKDTSHSHYPHHKTIKTPKQIQDDRKHEQELAAKEASKTPVTPPKSRATIELSQTDDVSVASIASIAKHEQSKRETLNNGDEVIVSLR